MADQNEESATPHERIIVLDMARAHLIVAREAMRRAAVCLDTAGNIEAANVLQAFATDDLGLIAEDVDAEIKAEIKKEGKYGETST